MKNKRSLGIYIHIPFCKSKCYYCDFCSSPACEETKSEYVKALIEDISSESAVEFLKEHTVDTVYFGGGTPTCLDVQALASVLDAVRSAYSVASDTEITAECNPGTVDGECLGEMKRAGFNRLSIGVQSIHDNELKALGRIHGFKDFDATFNNARAVGFDNISIDLMYGIPLQSTVSFEKTLRTVSAYSPEHISAYSLKIEPGTTFYKNRDKLILPDEDSEYNMYDLAVTLLGEAGYEHYEISNYAAKQYLSRHNLKYWNCDDYVGFGVAAHSCVGTKRYSVTSSVEKYIKSKRGSFEDFVCIEENLSLDEFAEEYIMMRMRLSAGLCVGELYNRFGVDFEKKYLSRMMPFVKSGHIIYSDGYVRLTKEGMYVSNYILSSILDLN